MTPLLFNLGKNVELSRDVATALGAQPGEWEVRNFPDGECYLRCESDCRNRPVIIVCSLEHPDDYALSALLAAATLRDLGAASVGLVAPYLPYMRQDKRFHAGEGITAHYFAKLISSNFDWLLTVDPHLHRISSLGEVYTIPSQVVHAAPLIAQWVSENIKHPLLVGPDSESEQWVADVAKRANAPYIILEKQRYSDRDVSVSIPAVDANSHCVPVLIDDIVSTGRTLIETIKCFQQSLMPAPVCAVVHGVFAAQSLEAIYASGAVQVVTCNTILHSSNAIDVSGELAGACRSLLGLVPHRMQI